MSKWWLGVTETKKEKKKVLTLLLTLYRNAPIDSQFRKTFSFLL